MTENATTGKVPVDECLTGGCNTQGPNGACSRCGYPNDHNRGLMSTDIDRIRSWQDELLGTQWLEGGSIREGWWRDVDLLLAEIDRLDDDNDQLRGELGYAIHSRDEWEANEQDASRRVDELEAIVRDLAERDLVTDIEPEWGTYVCLGCPDEHDETYDSAAEVVHHGSCVRRRAREWVAQHPTEETAE